MYAFGWLSRNAQVRAGPIETRTEPFEFGTPDGYQFFLDLGPVSNVNKRLFANSIPTWNDFVKHGTYDEYWQSKNVLKDLANVGHAVLNVVGWFDAEDYYGPLKIYYTIEKENPAVDNILVAGPWRHGGWASSAGDRLGNIRFGSETSHYFKEEIELPFFNYYLKDIGVGELPEASVFETGANEWRSYDRWPPRQATIRELYFHGDGSLSFTPPGNTAANEFSSFLSDPDKPVPYTAEIRTSQGHEWIVEDQRFVATRPDVLVFQSDVLESDVSIAGPIVASLSVATTGTDADWVVKLIDVYPPDAPDNEPNPDNVRMGGFQMMLAGDVFRSKFRNSFTMPQPLVPDRVTQIEFDLLDKHHTFLQGHKMMVQVQSTWFPLIDRNPQTFVDIYNAVAADFQAATHRVYHSAKYPSHIKLYVMER
jgi:putative CocE/NonD family hydrolase